LAGSLADCMSARKRAELGSKIHTRKERRERRRSVAQERGAHSVSKGGNATGDWRLAAGCSRRVALVVVEGDACESGREQRGAS